MSTRANIIIRDKWGDELIFYRHCDGYPEGTLPTLEKFVSWVRDERIRDNVGQASGWLIIIGHQEYKVGPEPGKPNAISDWKVGSYEPTNGIHGDIEYLYVVDMATCEIHINGGKHSYHYVGKYSEAAAAD